MSHKQHGAHKKAYFTPQIAWYSHEELCFTPRTAWYSHEGLCFRPLTAWHSHVGLGLAPHLADGVGKGHDVVLGQSEGLYLAEPPLGSSIRDDALQPLVRECEENGNREMIII